VTTPGRIFSVRSGVATVDAGSVKPAQPQPKTWRFLRVFAVKAGPNPPRRREESRRGEINRNLVAELILGASSGRVYNIIT